jgi:hypothetical protein
MDHGELQELGFDGYIQRPVTRDNILQQLEIFAPVE